jgi:hypothetical protein
LVDVNVLLVGVIIIAGTGPILVPWYLPKLLIDEMKKSITESDSHETGRRSRGRRLLDMYLGRAPMLSYLFYAFVLTAPLLTLLWGELLVRPLFTLIGATYSIGMVLALATVMMSFSLLFIREERRFREMVLTLRRKPTDDS